MDSGFSPTPLPFSINVDLELTLLCCPTQLTSCFNLDVKILCERAGVVEMVKRESGIQSQLRGPEAPMDMGQCSGGELG